MLTERPRYDEIRSMYIGQLASVWMEDSTTEAIRVSVRKKVNSFVEGSLEHATEVLSALWEIANNDVDVNAPSNTSPSGSELFLPAFRHYTRRLAPHNKAAGVTSPANWPSVKVALIKSIREGVLFDRKYWTRYSRTGDILKPVYFSSIIMGDKAQQLNDCTWKFSCAFIAVLKVPSGEIHQGPKRSHKRLGGRHQHRERL